MAPSFDFLNTFLELGNEFWAYVENINLEFLQIPFSYFHSTSPCKNLMAVITPTNSSFFIYCEKYEGYPVNQKR